jgi:penicillin-binding protein 2
MIQNAQEIQARLTVLWTLILLAGAVLGGRLLQIQIIQNVEYSKAAEKNRTQTIYQNAPRGRIYDRNGVPVASNRPAFSLIYLPSKNKDAGDLRPLANDLAHQLKQDPEETHEALQQAVREQSAVRLAENLPPQTMFRLSELKTIYPGVDLIVEARRYYPFGAFASHLLGYMGKMDPRSWKQLRTKGYRADSRIGKMGLESVFENELRGRDGGVNMEVDAQGRLKRILEKMPWEPGSNVYLTLDADTQKAADEALRKSPTGRGAVVALDPRNGEVLAFSSAPDFDPNSLLSSDPAEARKVIAGLPEFNHAISGMYPPGSAFKIIVGAAMLNEGKVSPDETVFCPGYFELGKKIFLCWEHKGHKKVDWFSGFAKSCDVYFYKMGLKVGGDKIEKYAKMFGLGEKTKVALKGERAGHLFGPETRAAANRSWYDGDTVNLSIGQGELLATPMQMAVVAAAVATKGTLWRPHFIDRIEYTEGRAEYKQRSERAGQVVLKESTWKLLHEAMMAVVTDGTAHQAIIPGIETRGKTGTAQNSGGDDHAWFVGFGNKPGEPPSIAVAVLVENGGHSSGVSVPVAAQVMRAYFRVKDPKSVSAKTVPPNLPLPQAGANPRPQAGPGAVAPH